MRLGIVQRGLGGDAAFVQGALAVQIIAGLLQLDPGMSGYSSLQPDCGAGAASCEALLLYEQSDASQVVMNPDRFIFRRISLPGHTAAPTM